MAVHDGREGGLDAPTRHPLNQNDAKFRDEGDLNKELERVFDICHGCRRCVSLCNAFPTLFDLVDESDTLEVDGVVWRGTVEVDGVRCVDRGLWQEVPDCEPEVALPCSSFHDDLGLAEYCC